MVNLLTEPVFRVEPLGCLTLPGLLAALVRDEVDSFPALRHHQFHSWYMFLVQLAALAMHGEKLEKAPPDEDKWRDLLRGLTSCFHEDEPWQLVVDDYAKPAFLQPPIEKGELGKRMTAPDELDLLITAKNHDIKQRVAVESEIEDWIFALMSLQTGEGYSGKNNYGIARMNGGASSRSMVCLAPLDKKNNKLIAPRWGTWFNRNLRILIETREQQLGNYSHLYLDQKDRNRNGIGLVWLEPWKTDQQIKINELDIWFIEICRRVRLVYEEGRLTARMGTSNKSRIMGKHLKGALGDPFAPVNKTEDRKSFTISEGDFGYRQLTHFFSGDWELPLLAEPAPFEKEGESLALVCAAISRGNSKTFGFKTRIVPMAGKVVKALGSHKEALHKLASSQVDDISKFSGALAYALKLAAVNGDNERTKSIKGTPDYVRNAHSSLHQYADSIFFKYLWAQLAEQDKGEKALETIKHDLHEQLWQRTQEIFIQALPALPCASLFRPLAEMRARQILRYKIGRYFPDIFQKKTKTTEEEELHHAI